MGCGADQTTWYHRRRSCKNFCPPSLPDPFFIPRPRNRPASVRNPINHSDDIFYALLYPLRLRLLLRLDCDQVEEGWGVKVLS